jgi:hypothetical protein
MSTDPAVEQAPAAPVAPAAAAGRLPVAVLRVVVLALIFVAVLTSCYVGAFHTSPPHRVPIGVSGRSSLHSDSTMRVSRYPDLDALTRGVRDGTIVGGLAVEGSGSTVLLGLAQGRAANQFAQGVLSRTAAAGGTTPVVRTLVPFNPGDPAGVVPFFVVLSLLVPSMIAGAALGAVKVVRATLRLLGLLGYATLATALNWLISDKWFDTLSGQHGSCTIVVFCYTLAVATCCAGLASWAPPLIALAGIAFLGLGIPATGGPAGLTYFVPELFTTLRSWLPPPVAVQGMRAAEYFGGNGLVPACLTLVEWIVLGAAALVAESLLRGRAHVGHLITAR